MAKTTSDVNYVTSRRPRTGDPIVPGSVVYDSSDRVISVGYYIGFNDDVELVQFSYTKEGYLVFNGVEYRDYEFNLWEATLTRKNIKNTEIDTRNQQSHYRVTDEYGTVVLADKLISNWEFVRLAGGKPAYGDGTGAFRSSNVAGTSEGYLIQLDFDEIFGIQWGFRLRHGTNDRFEIVIKDNITAINKMDAICYGSEF